MKRAVFFAWCVFVLVVGLLDAAAQPPGRGGQAGGGMPPMVAPEELIRMFDRDGDVRISREEAPERMRQRWDQIDTNHDRYITLEELKARDARVGGAAMPGQRGSGGAAGMPGGPGPLGAAPRDGAARGWTGDFRASATFSVITLGTGSPQYDPQRSGPAAIIQHRGRCYLVDMGNGTQARLNELGLTVRQLDGLLLTHHHLDHNEEFPPLFIHTRLAGAQPEIVGPPGTQKLADFVGDFYAEDIDYRMYRMGRTAADFGKPMVREIQGGEQFRLGALQVSTARVNHSIHTVAYRFDAEGHSIVISGDLSYTEALVTLAHAADVLVIDSGGSVVRQQQASGTRRPEGAAAPVAGKADALHAHGSLQEVIDMASKSAAKRLVLTHVVPGEVDEAATISGIRKIYSGEVIVARDLLEVPVAGEPRAWPGSLASRLPAPATTSDVPVAAQSAATGLAGGASSENSVVPAQITGKARVYVRAASSVAGSARTTRRDGKTWGTAFTTIQQGIDAAAKLGGEVWVAQGTYYPTDGVDREATVELRSGVAVYGGFAGSETRLEQRNWQKNKTVLSGDIGRKGVFDDNCYHVVTGADNALLDGFTITAGCAAGGGPALGGPGGGFGAGLAGPGQRGGPPPEGVPPQSGPGRPRRGGVGQMAIHTTPDRVLTASKNGFGGGMLNFQCAPTVRNCTFEGNRAGKGGAVYNMVARSFPPRRQGETASPLFIDCQFINNHAQRRGGAVANDLGTNPTLRGCTLLRNSCEEKGGGMYNDFGCSPTLVNCLLAENHAVTAGAMGNDGGSSPRIVHCTFAANTADEEGAALYQGTGPANNPTVVGCIFWGNQCANGPADIFNWHDNDPSVSGCCVESGYAGEKNFTADPRFRDPAGGDYRPITPACAAIGFSAAFSGQLPAMAERLGPPDRIASPRTKSLPPRTNGAKTIIYVRANSARKMGDGKSWATAFSSLQDGLKSAAAAQAEVWVAAGTYYPTADGNRGASFVLSDAVALYGGFRGNETSRDKRDWKTNATILSGDIGRPNDPSDNSYHVVVGADAAVLDGFTIRDGNADGHTYDAKGGGMINYRRGPQSGPMGAAAGYSPIVRNCTFADNRAHEGGAVYNYDRGQPQFVDCRFLHNAADYGGAMVDRVGVRSKLTGCEFSQNEARWRAGAVYLDYGARPELVNCRFDGNRSQCHGGALATVSRASQLESTIAVLRQCTFTGNTAQNQGGAIANSDHSAVALEACTLSQNQAASGGGVANTYRGQVVLIECRFSDNRATRSEADVLNESGATVSHNRADWPDQSQATPSDPGGTRSLLPPREASAL